MEIQGKWIGVQEEMGDVCPVFRKEFRITGQVKRADLQITALGVYEAQLNGARVGRFVLAPGWTSYEKRLQVQTYDVTDMLGSDNALEVVLGKGWYRSPMPGWYEDDAKRARMNRPGAILAALTVEYEDGTTTVWGTDESWKYGESPVRFSEIYDGEVYDARFVPEFTRDVRLIDHTMDILIPQEGEEVWETERVAAHRIFVTPSGETVVDFGQEVTGYVELSLRAEAGDRVRLRHGEVLDRDGNFYQENYRSAKAELTYICRDGEQTWHPRLTFFGFRYLRIDEFPGEPRPEHFTAVVVHSAMRRTGYVSCGHEKLNRLFSNIFWGQRGNSLDIPTDCPQRDERLGWTGDAQVFVKAASLNYDVEKFFRKWLRDLAADQREDGAVGQVIPDYLQAPPSAAWGDAAVICPWQIYMTYGNGQVLEEQFESMKKWVDFITSTTAEPYLWTGAEHCFGDWLGLDAPLGSYKGSSREELIQSAYYYGSCTLLIRAGEVLGRDMSAYRELASGIRQAFQRAYPVYGTQTEHVLALFFGLTPDVAATAGALEELIRRDGVRIRTGFVGTPYILHVLSENGYAKTAWDLLLREAYPSWLFSVNQGATTVWEHWDGIMEDGSFWSDDMNSFNHYAYGSVIDWVYEKAAGILPLEAGYRKIRIAPMPDARIGWLDVSLHTRHGIVRSKWSCAEGRIRYEIETPVSSEIVIGGRSRLLSAGSYTFWGTYETERVSTQ